ncbi:hypothetical protein OBV_19520 [Oscillibacter valericigenes Sjm18-20]|nr:hypothetical protein OBV_19520 [Oscillibacter valericigenes Sjm18-20]
MSPTGIKAYDTQTGPVFRARLSKGQTRRRFVSFPTVTVSLFCGYPHISELYDTSVDAEGHPPNFRYSPLLVIPRSGRFAGTWRW